ncbi:MAG: hypothetical protein ABW023_04460 [Sphingomonas sp.]
MGCAGRSANYSCINYKCTLLWTSDTEALVFGDICFQESIPTECNAPRRYVLSGGKWTSAPKRQVLGADQRKAMEKDRKAGNIEIRTVQRRQAYAGGLPVGEPFE